MIGSTVRLNDTKVVRLNDAKVCKHQLCWLVLMSSHLIQVPYYLSALFTDQLYCMQHMVQCPGIIFVAWFDL